ncbi:MAG: aminopeptidase P family protein [Alphaproteobacteria bacterium]
MPENHTLYQERLTSFRKEIKKSGLDGFIIPRTDEFQGEFLSPYAERLEWLSGFTGSAGIAIVTQEKAVVMSDGRYTIQLAQQVPTPLYHLGNSVDTSVGNWIIENVSGACKIGYDLWLHTPGQVQKIEEALADTGIELVPYDGHPIDMVWNDQPPRPANAISIFPNEVAGKTSQEKRKALGAQIQDADCQACLITVGDSICWLLNIRGADIDYSPLCLSYALLYKDGRVDWFVDSRSISDSVRRHVGAGVNICELETIEKSIAGLKGCLAIDNNTTPVWFTHVAQKHNVNTLGYDDPCVAPKAQKTQTEQQAIKNAHIEDGIAVVKFLHWLETSANIIDMSELSAERKLEEFRQESENYIAPSFPTIAGFAENGAIVHYRATTQTDKKISGNSLLLVDSGGQYRWGTTDITRTIAIGKPTQEMRENYTRVLKGHIAVADACFSEDTRGKDIDALARAPLHDVGLDYAHGTGHGVGCNLCVHEAATSISPRSEATFQEGMLISNEPGYYEAGEYGIRIENLVLTQRVEEGFVFETVTLAPFDPRLICEDMLNEGERAWLKSYAVLIYEALSSSLDQERQEWLRQYTVDIFR